MSAFKPAAATRGLLWRLHLFTEAEDALIERSCLVFATKGHRNQNVIDTADWHLIPRDSDYNRCMPTFILPGTRICRYYSQRPCRARNFMQFVSDYMKAIDFVTLTALVVIGAASFSRGGTIWLLVAAVVVAIWGASRLFGFF